MTKILAPLSAQLVAYDATHIFDRDTREDFFIAKGSEKNISCSYEVRGKVHHDVFVEVQEGAMCTMQLFYNAHEKDTKMIVRISALLHERAQISLDIASICDGVAQESDVRVYVVFNEGARATARVYTRASASRSVVHEEIRGLTLGDAARVSFIPELSLLHDDIVATHATSVMKIDEEHVAYLCSRGVLREDAVKCIADAFLWRST